ncbi:carbohydrate sulfotransferase 11-like isoform X3 [Penaeus japonicus]|uniref:carbohydrate sulfotransferase 11-like isoform X3 n=1 Tax=Penaeus japonicus TaxID=27405 RepID=UPI001C70BA14|nr:carbohydrate sulfotransferase 11-like isoform X3 [Penaeus japonicus]
MRARRFPLLSCSWESRGATRSSESWGSEEGVGWPLQSIVNVAKMCITWTRGWRQAIICASLGLLLFAVVHLIAPFGHREVEYVIRPSWQSPQHMLEAEGIEKAAQGNSMHSDLAIKPEEAADTKTESKNEETGSLGSKERNEILQRRIQDTCNTLNISLPINAYMLSHMHFDHKRKLIYCYVPKVACTSWKRVWMKMIGKVPPEKDLSTIGRYTVHTSVPNMGSQRAKADEMFATYKKFLFVRHPFDRVLSAFKDKLESYDKTSIYDFHKEIGARIQKKYRGEDTNTDGHNTTFSEFIRFISELGHGTFEQRNEHWLSVHEICNPCAVKYDFVGKYEHLKEDANYVLEWMGVTDLVSSFPASDRPFFARRYDPKYFSQLSHSDKMAFFTKYLADFVAFDYDFV